MLLISFSMLLVTDIIDFRNIQVKTMIVLGKMSITQIIMVMTMINSVQT